MYIIISFIKLSMITFINNRETILLIQALIAKIELFLQLFSLSTKPYSISKM